MIIDPAFQHFWTSACGSSKEVWALILPLGDVDRAGDPLICLEPQPQVVVNPSGSAALASAVRAADRRLGWTGHTLEALFSTMQGNGARFTHLIRAPVAQNAMPVMNAVHASGVVSAAELIGCEAVSAQKAAVPIVVAQLAGLFIAPLSTIAAIGVYLALDTCCAFGVAYVVHERAIGAVVTTVLIGIAVLTYAQIAPHA